MHSMNAPALVLERIREAISPWSCLFMSMYGPSHFDLSLLELSVRGLCRRTKLSTSKSLFLTFGSL
jgi:hypothetical protein